MSTPPMPTPAKKMSFIFTHNGTMTVLVKRSNKSYTIPPNHANYTALKECIASDNDIEFEKLADVPSYVVQFSSGKVKVVDGTVYYNDQPINTQVAMRILQLMEAKLPCDSMINFLEKLMQNPSKHSVDELFSFLEHQGMPIDEDGDFYAYKRVNQDFTDCYSSRFLNTVGSRMSIARNTVDDDWRLDCSSGFHVGCMEYVRDFHREGRIVIVKVNPKDVVSVPTNEVTKCRVCEYVVVSEYTGDLVESPVYSSSNDGYTTPVKYTPTVFNYNNEDEDEYDDEDEDDNDSEVDDDEDFDDDDDDDDSELDDDEDEFNSGLRN